MVKRSPLVSLSSWVLSLFFESFAVAAALLARFYRQKDDPKPGKLPLLLVHGYLHDSTAWIYLKPRLEKEGWGPIFTIDLGAPFGSIKNHAQILSNKIETLQKEHHFEKIALLGHSMGGLVCAWYATQMAEKGKVPTVITLGSPLKGTWAAYLAYGINGKEMRPSSTFVEALRKNIEQSKILFFHLGSMTDLLILPYTAAVFGKDKEREHMFSILGHMTMLYSSRVARQIHAWLGEIDAIKE